MNREGFTYLIESSGDSEQVFSLLSRTGTCVGKILFSKRDGRMGGIYELSRLGTANGGEELDKLGLSGIERKESSSRGLLYVMFRLFIQYIQTIDSESFSINIDRPLFHLEDVYRKLYRHLMESSSIDSGSVTRGVAIFRCER